LERWHIRCVMPTCSYVPTISAVSPKILARPGNLWVDAG